MYYCGIDVAKRKHAVALVDEHGQLRKPVFSAENTRLGLDGLVSALAGLGEEVSIGFVTQ